MLTRARTFIAAARRASWFWNDIFVPFIATRLAWLLAGAYARGNYPPNPSYAERAIQGYQYSRFFFIEYFTRWDSGFYLKILKEGYIPPADPTVAYSPAAFFPLYPYLVRWLGWLAGGWWMERVPDGLYLVIGQALSNLCFLLAAALLYRLATRHLLLPPETARRALLLLMLYPTAFIFASFYTESLFLFLTVAAWAAALERRWTWAALLAALCAVTRPQGVISALAIGLLFAQARAWKPQAMLTRDALPFLAIPALLGAHLFDLYRKTGSWLSPVTAQLAWGRGQYGFIEGMRIQLEAPVFDVFKLDFILLVLTAACGIYLLARWPVKAYGVYTLLLAVIPLSSGLVIAGTRYVMVAFPIFLLAARLLNRRWSFELACAGLFALQIILFSGWVNWFWIV